jgi:S1-C subfamily serine protease
MTVCLPLLVFAMLLFVPVENARAEGEKAIVFIRSSAGSDGAPSTAAGSGFLVSGSGYLVTARHVIQPSLTTGTGINVSLGSKNSYPVPAQVYYCPSDGPDICILKINASDVSDHKIANEDLAALACRELKIGETISAQGYPAAGEANSLFTVPGQIVGDIGPQFLYPTALPTAPGMSGGPVYDSSGKIIGVIKGTAVGTPHTYITPVSQIRGKLGDINIPCDASPMRRGEQLLPSIFRNAVG